MSRPEPLLHRNDPARAPLVGNVKVTSADWLNLARELLITDGVEQVKIAPLGARLGVSRSSFYWYFESREALLDALLQEWDACNTASLVAQAAAPADRITGAVLNVFHCVIDTRLFDSKLDFAIRAWARGSARVRTVLEQSDATRLNALTAMFARYDYPADEAATRARILYYMQRGYDDAELNEALDARLEQVPMYVLGFTGERCTPGELEAFETYARANYRQN